MSGAAYSLLFLCYLFIPWFLSLRMRLFTAPALILFYLINLLLLIGIIYRRNLNLNKLAARIAQIQERINLEDSRNYQAHQNNFALCAKKERYKSLSDILEGLNQELDVRKVVSHLCRKAFSLIAGGKGSCSVSLIDQETNKLSLFYSLRHNEQEVMTSKEGDIFDWWVMRHVSPLLIEDIRKDFRFDQPSFKDKQDHLFVSLMSAALISGGKVLGIIRLDSPQPNFYTQDDVRFLTTASDLAAVAIENSQLYARAQDLAIHDELTGLYTKTYFLRRLQEECLRAAHQREQFALLMLDIDFFKKYNDTFGHTMGDIVLKKLSSIMRSELAEYNPLIGRFGGEEFCIIFPGADKKAGLKAAERLRGTVEKSPITLRRQETGITISVGLAAFPAYGLDADSVLDSADHALYKAKATGRNKVC